MRPPVPLKGQGWVPHRLWVGERWVYERVRRLLKLIAAKTAGYDVPAALLDGLRDYLTGELQSTRTYDSEPLTPGMRALLCHVLAGLGQPPYGWLARLTERVADLDMEGRAHLAAAWLAAGSWTDFTNVTYTGPIIITDASTGTSTNKFYRAVTP